ncbi:MAG: hypothetical protein D6808_00965 [Candidatus Dadabacteria bacterium]|nr:MAG: hypothetical protein D6808_00965 [Candidatus Dadabacteria bacterium]
MLFRIFEDGFPINKKWYNLPVEGSKPKKTAIITTCYRLFSTCRGYFISLVGSLALSINPFRSKKKNFYLLRKS